MKNIMIMFPPNHQDFTKPNLILSKLAGFLRKKNIDCTPYDVNIEWIHFLLSDDGALKLKKECVRVFSELNNRESMNPVQQKIYGAISWIAIIPEKTLVDEVKSVLATFKGDNYFKFMSLHKANRFLLRLINAANVLLLNYDGSSNINPYISYKEIKRLIGVNTIYHIFYKNNQGIKNLHKFDYIVISLVTSSQLLHAFILAKLIKDNNDRIKIILAGQPITIIKDELKQKDDIFNLFDYLIYGEIEYPLLDIINNNEPTSINNLMYKDVKGKVIETPLRSWNVTQHGDLDFVNMDLNRYLNPIKVLPLYASKGCIWGKCKFCCIHKYANRYEERELEQIIDNIKYLKSEFKVTVFYFPDEALSPNILTKFSQRLLKEKLKIYWTAQTRFSGELNYEVFKKVSDSGCIHIEFGLESANTKTLVEMNKGIDLGLVRRNLRDAKKANIINTVNIIVGYPGDLEPQETLDFLIENKAYIDRVTCFAFFVTRGSQLEKKCEDYGIHIERTDKNDFQLSYMNYSSVSSLNWEEKDRNISLINKKLNSYDNAFISNPYPILEYCVHYNTRDVKEIEKNSEGSRRKSLSVLRNNIATKPERKRGIEIVDLNYKHFIIKKSFRSIFITDSLMENMEDMKQSPIEVVFDTLEDNTFQVPQDVIWLLKNVNGYRDIKELAKMHSIYRGRSFEQSFKKIKVYLTIYQFLFNE